MIISDGTTDLTFEGTQVDDFIEIEKSTKISSGGKTKSQTAGGRFRVIENIRITASEWSSLNALLTNGANYYYYTPTNIPGYMNSSQFPMSVNISAPQKFSQEWGGEKYYRIKLEIIGEDYL